MKAELIILLLLLTLSNAFVDYRLRARIYGFLGKLFNRLAISTSINVTRHEFDNNSICGQSRYMDLIQKECQKICNDNRDCRSTEICCINSKKCIDPCSSDPCKFNKLCIVQNHENNCNKSSDWMHDNILKIIDIECYTHNHCPEDKQCIRNTCKDACENRDCRQDEVCIAKNHRGYCWKSEVGLASMEGLDAEQHKRNNSQTNSNDTVCYENECHENPCKNLPCYQESDEKCYPSQSDPHKCKCPLNLTMNEQNNCVECTDHGNCSNGFLCHQEKCIPNPCHNLSCFENTNSTCELSNSDRSKCVCKSNYTGTPSDGCYAATFCVDDEWCPYDEKCMALQNDRAICINVCKCIDCPSHLSCHVVRKHEAECRCKGDLLDNGSECLPANKYAIDMKKRHCADLSNTDVGDSCYDDTQCNNTSICCNEKCTDVCHSRKCNNGQICIYKDRNGYCDCPENYVLHNGECKRIDESKRCGPGKYYDNDFHTCRLLCTKHIQCYEDEICSINGHCEYLCRIKKPGFTCIAYNHRVEYANMDCKYDNENYCQCRPGSYMNADRSVCLLYCSVNNPCRNGMKCGKNNRCFKSQKRNKNNG